jgi:hypothetical protein
MFAVTCQMQRPASMVKLKVRALVIRSSGRAGLLPPNHPTGYSSGETKRADG